MVNTSGSGKTRLLFEGLCKHWGLYFTCAGDGNNLGSADLERVYFDNGRFTALAEDAHLPSTPDISTELDLHRKAARRAFWEVLLAHLLVFKLFAEIMHEDGQMEEHKQRWLMVQLQATQIIGDSMFDTIGYQLADVSDTYLEDTIRETFAEIHKLCDITSGLFFAIDEANYAVSQHLNYFRDGGGQYPLFKEHVRSWRDQIEPFNGSIIVAGTDIPKLFFEYEPGEWDRFNWSSNTGGFDNEELHEQYITPFIPPTFRQSVSGQVFIHRVWQWLRGRLVYGTFSLTD